MSSLLHLCQEKCTHTELLCLRDLGEASLPREMLSVFPREKNPAGLHTQNLKPQEKLTPKLQEPSCLSFVLHLSTKAVKVTGTLRVPHLNCSH